MRLVHTDVLDFVFRYRFMISSFVPRFWANIVAVVLPWAIALVFYTGSLITNLLCDAALSKANANQTLKTQNS